MTKMFEVLEINASLLFNCQLNLRETTIDSLLGITYQGPPGSALGVSMIWS